MNVRPCLGRSTTKDIIPSPLQIQLNYLLDDDYYIYVKLFSGGQPIDRTSEVPVLLGAQRPWDDRKILLLTQVRVTTAVDLPGLISTTIPLAIRHGIIQRISALRDSPLAGGSWLYPDLDCEGSLSWTKIKPGATIMVTSAVENIGDQTSELTGISSNGQPGGIGRSHLLSGYLALPRKMDRLQYKYQSSLHRKKTRSSMEP